jgi:hypothetical protein
MLAQQNTEDVVLCRQKHHVSTLGNIHGALVECHFYCYATATIPSTDVKLPQKPAGSPTGPNIRCSSRLLHVTLQPFECSPRYRSFHTISLDITLDKISQGLIDLVCAEHTLDCDFSQLPT